MRFTGIVGSTIYLLGLLVVQANLLRHGIFDLSTFEFYYLLVGLWLLVTIVPAFIIAANIEAFVLSGSINPFKVIRAFPLTPAILAILALAAILWTFSYRSLAVAVNFNCYFFPKWYAAINILYSNIAFIIIWAVILAIRSRRAPVQYFRILSCGAIGIYLLVYAIFFGRTIYPAIDQGFGGGAPQLAEIESSKGVQKAILLFSSNTGRYFLALDEFPLDVRTRDGYRQYITDRNGPVHRAMIENQVRYLPRSEVKSITIHSVRQADSYNRFTNPEALDIP